MTENKPKIKSIENTENANEKKKKHFFEGLRNRFLALAMAGFITLGAGWGKDLLRQFEVRGEKKIISHLSLSMVCFITWGAGWEKDLLRQFEVTEKEVIPDIVPVDEIKEVITSFSVT